MRSEVGFFDPEAARAQAVTMRKSLVSARARVASDNLVNEAKEVVGREVFSLSLGRFRLGLRKLDRSGCDARGEKVGGGDE